jgi:hypothetical protein
VADDLPSGRNQILRKGAAHNSEPDDPDDIFLCPRHRGPTPIFQNLTLSHPLAMRQAAYRSGNIMQLGRRLQMTRRNAGLERLWSNSAWVKAVRANDGLGSAV